MPHPYRLADEADVFSPALVFYPELIRKNVARVVELAGSPDHLRPHAKTHKTREITKLQLDAGVTKHKCATIAEAEVLADAGVPDVLIAYQLLGPNLRRLAALARKFPLTQFSALIDCPSGADGLSRAAAAAGRSLGFFIDLDVGQHRSGIAVGDDALSLYERAAKLPGLRAEGLHAYDGHNNQEPRADREAAVRAALKPVLELRAELERRGLPVPRIVAGGTPTFPVYASLRDVPGLECSPGTYVLHDHGYGTKYPDLSGVTPAAVLLTRVVSRPTANRVTFDAGNKAVGSDPPMAKRIHLLDVPDCEVVGHNEEHLIVETPAADRFAPGDVVYALPGHVCPTVALHREALVAEGGRVTGRWAIASRDRMLTV
ncbi:MAG TPA: D-TA family PLP-dependent enzyme [Fimbriiglobus sp.]|nr:D-TA family PLP-dependent enzyme [Fimbriiglobus sp.]